MTRVRRRLNRGLVEREPHARWNAFVDLLAMEDADRLSTTQRAAHLAFWYDSEVSNGGHDQYFANESGRLAPEAVVALRTMGAASQADLLAEALRAWSAIDREAPATAEEYVEMATRGELDAFDARYAACQPDLTAVLRRYLDQHEDEFIEYEPG